MKSIQFPHNFYGATIGTCRRASATALVAVVFLADRLAKWLLPQPSKWTAAGCNALAALLCHLDTGEYWLKTANTAEE
jgi:hypothetical protein